MSGALDYYEIPTPEGHPPRRIEFGDVIALIDAGHGPVKLADLLKVSRKTERKIRSLALDWACRPPLEKLQVARTRDGKAVTTGEHKKVQAAQRMLSEGATEQEVMDALNVGYKRGKRIITMAGQSGIVAMAVDPRLMDEQIQACLDAMAEIVETARRLESLGQFLEDKVNELQQDTAHDVDYIPLPGDDEDSREIVSVKPFHEKNRNIINAVAEMRKLEDTRLKAVTIQERVLEKLFDVRRVNDMFGDIHQGVREAVIAWIVSGKLRTTKEEALKEITDAVRHRFMVRKGLASVG